ncbi:agamous-like MADS-box protein AGL80 [Prunus avium]|uniref:Agamous-like MADS-box protein AGL80 n=1 Tax=Prunus avium TaxID=42229 RepID=A0A6P5SFN1_PRUAV|nr:agamous-like MADS-box protein AGL80 [Prunus avium]
MTRKKVSLTYITNDSARKATFKKRKTGLMKKGNELSTLCDIQACIDLNDLGWLIDQNLKELVDKIKTRKEELA